MRRARAAPGPRPDRGGRLAAHRRVDSGLGPAGQAPARRGRNRPRVAGRPRARCPGGARRRRPAGARRQRARAAASADSCRSRRATPRAPTRRCAVAATSCSSARPSSPSRATPIPPTRASSASSRPTRRGSCACSPSRAPAGRRHPHLAAARRRLLGRRARPLDDRRARRLPTPDRLPAYLSNLFRLGLIWFSRERLDEPRRYQVLEAQPDVIEAVRESRPGADRPPQHPPDPVRRALLQPGAATRHGRDRGARRVRHAGLADRRAMSTVVRDSGRRALLPPFTDEHEELRETISPLGRDRDRPARRRVGGGARVPARALPPRRRARLSRAQVPDRARWPGRRLRPRRGLGRGARRGGRLRRRRRRPRGAHGIATPPIFRFGTPEQHERFLRPAIAGERIARPRDHRAGCRL